MEKEQEAGRLESTEQAVEQIIKRTGGSIRLGMPLGLGKPNHLVNVLYRRAREDASITLDIYTALSLGRPSAGSDLEKRFLEPFADRVFGDHEELDYLADLRRGNLPDNVRVFEFFFRPGAMLGNAHAQRHYISSNYTHVPRDLNARGVNVAAQMVAADPHDPSRLSLSSNPEVTLEMLPLLEERRRRGETIIGVACVHPDMPWMAGEAEVDADIFDLVVDDHASHRRLFSTPNLPVELQDHMIGLHASALVRDGGTLQIGIGALGDALVHHLLLRHRDNDRYRQLLDASGCLGNFAGHVEALGGTGTFSRGIYGCSEMFTWGLMCLIDAGIIARRVYDDEALQEQANAGNPPEGEGGVFMHGGFLLGPEAFYQRLRELEPALRNAIRMGRIGFVNHLYGRERLKRLQRLDARFVNTVFSATLLGAAVSDQLEDGRVVSGVGGQYNFVSQAHELEGARSILLLRSFREKGGRASSNLLWSYGHTTIPRHLRDVYVTEYGIADLRARSDAEAVAAMLNIADSRFQPELLRQAQEAGKIARDYSIPEPFRHNSPERLEALRRKMPEAFPAFPLGSDFTAGEERLVHALGWLRNAMERRQYVTLLRAVLTAGDAEAQTPVLERMELAQPQGLRERLYRRLLSAALDETAGYC